MMKQLKYYWAYALILTPFVTDWIETGRTPAAPRELVTEVTVALLIGGCVYVIYRDLKRMRMMAETDSLTGLFNRRKFIEDLRHEVAMAKRLRSDLSLVYLDVDGFKDINDHHGHEQGDAVLRELANLLRNGTRREVDRFYRLGGDEFAVLLPGTPETTAARMIREMLTGHAAANLSLARHGTTVSMGTAQLGPDEDVENFLRRADLDMYQRKMRRAGPEPKGESATTA